MARDPLMKAASEYAKAMKKVGLLRGQMAAAVKRGQELDGKIVAATKDADAAKKALDLAAGAEGGRSSTGTGGSMARFTIVGDYLYTLHMDSIVLVDVTVPEEPRLVEEPVYVGWDIETVFPDGEELYIGSSTGMYIYDICLSGWLHSALFAHDLTPAACTHRPYSSVS